MRINIDYIRIVSLLITASKVIAILVALLLLVNSGIIVVQSIGNIIQNEIELAIQDGLFVLILLEMFYVVRSFIKYGSINVGIVVNVGIIAIVKEMIFRLDALTIQSAAAFSVLLISLATVYLMEIMHYQKKGKNKIEQAVE